MYVKLKTCCKANIKIDKHKNRHIDLYSDADKSNFQTLLKRSDAKIIVIEMKNQTRITNTQVKTKSKSNIIQ